MSIPSWPSKDPDEILDYAIDWSDRLPIEDLIAQSIWTVPAGLAQSRSEFAGQQSVVWLSDPRLLFLRRCHTEVKARVSVVQAGPALPGLFRS
jgi:hypothetical protein